MFRGNYFLKKVTVYFASDVVICLICAYYDYFVPSSGLLLFVAYYSYLIS